MTVDTTEDRRDGAFTFAIAIFLALVWMAASVLATDDDGILPVSGLIGMGIIAGVGFIVATWIGFYNLGRKRGR